MSLLRAFALSLPAVLLAACGAEQPPADDARVVRTTTVTTDDGRSPSDYSGEVRVVSASARHRCSGNGVGTSYSLLGPKTQSPRSALHPRPSYAT